MRSRAPATTASGDRLLVVLRRVLVSIVLAPFALALGLTLVDSYRRRGKKPKPFPTTAPLAVPVGTSGAAAGVAGRSNTPRRRAVQPTAPRTSARTAASRPAPARRRAEDASVDIDLAVRVGIEAPARLHGGVEFGVAGFHARRERARVEFAVGPRVGVAAAKEEPLRFWIAGDPTVSAYRPQVHRRRRT